MKRWRGDFRKERYWQKYQHCFYLEECTQIELSISKKNNGRAYGTKIKDKELHFDYCFKFDANTKSIFVRKLFNRQSKCKKLPVVNIPINQRKRDKNIYFDIFFSLVRNRTNQKSFDRNFKIWIEYQKNNTKQEFWDVLKKFSFKLHLQKNPT